MTYVHVIHCGGGGEGYSDQFVLQGLQGVVQVRQAVLLTLPVQNQFVGFQRPGFHLELTILKCKYQRFLSGRMCLPDSRGGTFGPECHIRQLISS